MKRCNSCDKGIDAGLLVCQECRKENKKLKEQIRLMAEFINEIDSDSRICEKVNVNCTDMYCVDCIIKIFESEVIK